MRFAHLKRILRLRLGFDCVAHRGPQDEFVHNRHRPEPTTARQIGRPAAAICAFSASHGIRVTLSHQAVPLLDERHHQHPVKNLNRNPRQPNQLLSQQNRPFADVPASYAASACWVSADCQVVDDLPERDPRRIGFSPTAAVAGRALDVWPLSPLNASPYDRPHGCSWLRPQLDEGL